MVDKLSSKTWKWVISLLFFLWLILFLSSSWNQKFNLRVSFTDLAENQEQSSCHRKRNEKKKPNPQKPLKNPPNQKPIEFYYEKASKNTGFLPTTMTCLFMAFIIIHCRKDHTMNNIKGRQFRAHSASPLCHLLQLCLPTLKNFSFSSQQSDILLNGPH